MTRINAHIQVKTLCDRHLIAEYREILRPNKLAINKAQKEGKSLLNNIQQTFTLGTGHVTFFYDKLKYIELRFNLLKTELINRGINANINYELPNIKEYLWLYNDWNNNAIANDLIIDRILERAKGMKVLHYNKKQISISEYKLLLETNKI